MTRPLKGLRLVVSGYEFEQQEHRGIAVFSKGLLRALKESGAEIWLLTGFQAPMQDIAKAQLPKNVQKRIRAARILDTLNSAESMDDESGLLIKLLQLLPLTKQILNILKQIHRLKQKLFPKRWITRQELQLLPRSELINSPYQRCERLSYLSEIDGLICANNCFLNSIELAKRKHPHSLHIDLRGFDGLITTSPLNIKPVNTRLFVQTVHDLIPLDYQRTRDHLPCFTRRLQAAGPAKRFFVSEDARQHYELSILGTLSNPNRLQRVVTQSPSLQFPGDCLDWEARTRQVRVLSSNQSQLHALKPCSYFLFNSSVVPHKNLLFALKAFMESDLEQKNIRFCITGKPQNDEYSEAVRSVAAKHKSVIFTGYVDEATKRQLYLNALALLSPSLIEGFGIPVLDAACLGLSAIASPLGSHREIQAMHDFKDHVMLCSTLVTSDWASAMRLIALKNELSLSELSPKRQRKRLNQMRAERIQRYRHYQTLIDEAFQSTICDLLTSEEITVA